MLGLGNTLSGGIVPAAAADTAFTFTIDTENAGSATKTFVLPLISDGAIDINVDWGDDSTSSIDAYDHSDVTHVYDATGIYTVKLTGTIRGFRFNNGGDKLKILNISNWGDFNVTLANTFMGCTNLDCSATDAPTVSTSSPTAMFYFASRITNIGGDWDMSGVESLYLFFYQASVFNGASLDSWDTSSVTNMNGVFRRAPAFNADISGWDTSSVTNMTNMFDGWPSGAFDQDLSNWDVSSVTTFGSNFMRSQTLSTANYDALLIGWAAQSVTSGLSINFGSSKYTAAPAAGGVARQSLIEDDSWTITDGGTA